MDYCSSILSSLFGTEKVWDFLPSVSIEQTEWLKKIKIFLLTCLKYFNDFIKATENKYKFVTAVCKL